jgi:uncharacterized membrane protein
VLDPLLHCLLHLLLLLVLTLSWHSLDAAAGSQLLLLVDGALLLVDGCLHVADNEQQDAGGLGRVVVVCKGAWAFFVLVQVVQAQSDVLATYQNTSAPLAQSFHGWPPA